MAEETEPKKTEKPAAAAGSGNGASGNGASSNGSLLDRAKAGTRELVEKAKEDAQALKAPQKTQVWKSIFRVKHDDTPRARALAPAVAQAVRAANVAGPVHVSGCAKGCAHPAPSPLTIIGRAGACDIHLNGTVVSSAKAEALPAELERLLTSGAVR